MTRGNRKSAYDDLSRYCMLAKKYDFIEVTQWSNGEGWDVTINDRHFHLTHGELDAINYLTKAIESEDSE